MIGGIGGNSHPNHNSGIPNLADVRVALILRKCEFLPKSELEFGFESRPSQMLGFPDSQILGFPQKPRNIPKKPLAPNLGFFGDSPKTNAQVGFPRTMIYSGPPPPWNLQPCVNPGPVLILPRKGSEVKCTCWDPEYGELCLDKTKPEEISVEVCCGVDVQIARQSWV